MFNHSAATDAVKNDWPETLETKDKNSASVLLVVLLNPTESPIIKDPADVLLPDVSG